MHVRYGRWRCAALLLASVHSALPAAAAASSSQQEAPPPACTAPEHRQFDFWLGRWAVYPTGKPRLVAHSLIEKLYDGCTIRENWMPLNRAGGGSLNMYDPSDRRWHQTWQDAQNSRVEFDGGLVDGKMVLVGYWRGIGGPGKDAWVRIAWTPDADGSVRQYGEQSVDHGATWSPAFDLTYKPAASSAAE